MDGVWGYNFWKIYLHFFENYTPHYRGMGGIIIEQHLWILILLLILKFRIKIIELYWLFNFVYFIIESNTAFVEEIWSLDCYSGSSITSRKLFNFKNKHSFILHWWKIIHLNKKILFHNCNWWLEGWDGVWHHAE